MIWRCIDCPYTTTETRRALHHETYERHTFITYSHAQAEPPKEDPQLALFTDLPEPF